MPRTVTLRNGTEVDKDAADAVYAIILKMMDRNVESILGDAAVAAQAPIDTPQMRECDLFNAYNLVKRLRPPIGDPRTLRILTGTGLFELTEEAKVLTTADVKNDVTRNVLLSTLSTTGTYGRVNIHPPYEGAKLPMAAPV
jgi:hypothetical protein